MLAKKSSLSPSTDILNPQTGLRAGPAGADPMHKTLPAGAPRASWDRFLSRSNRGLHPGAHVAGALGVRQTRVAAWLACGSRHFAVLPPLPPASAREARRGSRVTPHLQQAVPPVPTAVGNRFRVAGPL